MKLIPFEHSFDLNTIIGRDIDTYGNNFTNTLFNMAKLFIPNKIVSVKPYEIVE